MNISSSVDTAFDTSKILLDSSNTANFRTKYYKIVDDFVKYKHDENDLHYLDKYMSVTKANVVIDLIQTHYHELNNEIGDVLNLKDDDLFGVIRALLILKPLTNGRKFNICSMIAYAVNGEIGEKYEKLIEECNKKFGKLIDYTKRLKRSIDLCGDENEIKELLTQQGFIKNGLILAPEEVEVKI